jgi:beta-galactosidase
LNSKQDFQWDKIELGVCYYPEHWDKTLWNEDLRRMLQSGIKTVRIAEFAWSKFEPEEGEFTFEFFDEFMDLVNEMGMKVIFGTPTATPPAWLTEKYPQVLNSDIEGTLYRHGGRRHYNYNSPKYLELSARIVTKLAEHYGQHPSIVGWQIDNELNCEKDVFYSDSDTIAFREFLQNKYGTLEGLNKAWGATFWNQTYSAWEEVHVPRKTIQPSSNPHMELDYIRFISDSCIRFCKLQSDIVRKYKKEQDFITTNGMFGNLDNHRMEKECLDVYTYDSYPNFAYCLSEDPKNTTGLRDRNSSNSLAEVRSICEHFGIMEQQSGANGWNSCMEAPAPKPGQMTLWAMQSIAHGADYISFFRWRTCTMGTEIYWHGILDYDNRDNRKLREVQKLHQRVDKIADIAGAKYRAAFAVIKDYDNAWDSKIDVWHKHVERKSSQEIFVASQLTHTPLDYIYLQVDSELSDLINYPVIMYPHASILTEDRVKLLKAYVEQGGCLILGCRTGYKDITGQCVMMPMPGLAASLTGTTVEEFTLIGPGDDSVRMNWDGKYYETPVFNDVLEVTDPSTKVLATYSNNFYTGKPAMTEHKYGKGHVIYLGSTFTREITSALFEYTGVISPFKYIINAPSECEIALRQKGDKNYLFILNYSHQTSSISLQKEALDVDLGTIVNGTVELQPYETKVYQL